ncbi:unnamed protein product [Schistosoma rodhaini]|uniref:Uncharacterized protein n=1 Tax=Schistosoma rodhaini TaxID=6188 RepID=A0AA85EW21_9TREM|nr:unnamed protein product [Schistosoma rodhaini]
MLSTMKILKSPPNPLSLYFFHDKSLQNKQLFGFFLHCLLLCIENMREYMFCLTKICSIFIYLMHSNKMFLIYLTENGRYHNFTVKYAPITIPCIIFYVIRFYHDSLMSFYHSKKIIHSMMNIKIVVLLRRSTIILIVHLYPMNNF